MLDPAANTWVSLVDAAKIWRKRKIDPKATRDIVALLALSPEERAVAADVAALSAAKKGKADPPSSPARTREKAGRGDAAAGGEKRVAAVPRIRTR